MSLAGTAGGVAVTLAKLGVPINYYGCIGKDEKGTFLLDTLSRYSIDQSNMQIKVDIPTSATVINVRSNGDRPCLHQLGASDHLTFTDEDIEIICSKSKILHIGICKYAFKAIVYYLLNISTMQEVLD